MSDFQNLDGRLLRFRNRPGSEAAVPLAEALIDAGRSSEALEVAARGLEKSGEEARLLIVQGRSLLHEGALLRAQASLLKAARADPKSTAAFRWLGEVLIQRGDPQRAAKVLERALNIDPNDEVLRRLSMRARKGNGFREQPKTTAPKDVSRSEDLAPQQSRNDVHQTTAVFGSPEIPEASPFLDEAGRRSAQIPSLESTLSFPVLPSTDDSESLPLANTSVVADNPVTSDLAKVSANEGAPEAWAFSIAESQAPTVAGYTLSDFDEDAPTAIGPRLDPRLVQGGPLEVSELPVSADDHPRLTPDDPAFDSTIPLVRYAEGDGADSVDPSPESPAPSLSASLPDSLGSAVASGDTWSPKADLDHPPLSESDLSEESNTVPREVLGVAPAALEPADEVLAMMDAAGLREQDDPSPSAWTQKSHSDSKAGNRTGRTIAVLWVVAALLGLGGYLGWTTWVETKRAESIRLVGQARDRIWRGDHQDLLEAEQLIRASRELNPLDSAGPELLIFAHVQRVLEEGGADAGALRSSLSMGKRLGLGGSTIFAAQAVLALWDGDVPAAATHAENALKDENLRASDRYVVGRVRQRLGMGDAAALLQRAHEEESNLFAASMALAEFRAKEGRLDAAKAVIDSVLARENEHLRARLWRQFFDAAEVTPEAGLSELSAIKGALEKAAPVDVLLYHLTEVRLSRRMSADERARSALDRAFAAEVVAPRLLALLAAESRELGRLDQAQSAAASALAGAPMNVALRTILAEILIQRRNGIEALRVLEPLSVEDSSVLRLAAQASLLVGTTEVLQGVVRDLSSALDSNPVADSELRALWLRAQMRLETSSRTLELAKELDAEFPADRFATEALAEAALDVGEVQTAQVAADRLVAAAPEFAQGHVLRGRARRMSGDAAAAEESYRQALTLSPEHTDAQIALAYLLLDRGSFDESNALFQELDEQGESAARGSTALMARIGGIEALLGLQRVAEAERQLDQLSPEDRDLVTVRMATARLALLQRRSTEAVSALRPLVGAEGATADVLALFADALESAGELDAASRYYELAVERDGGHPEALLGLARVLTRAERLDEAEEHMDRVEDSLQQRIRPPLLRAQLLLLQGRVRIQRGKMRAARVALQSASEIEGCPAEVWFFLGEALAGHNSPRSRAAYDRYLEIHPEGPFAARARRATDRPNP